MNPTIDRKTPWRRVGLGALVLSAVVFGLLEVHSSTDTWIGLATGREILANRRVPQTDSFSYTAPGQPWVNQNWLTHTVQYALYSHLGPDAVIIGNWMLCLVIFALSGLAAGRRTGNSTAGWLAMAVTAIGCRDFVSARPATVGFFCFSVAWALFSELQHPVARRRGAIVVALALLLLFWGNAHGSFLLGYGMIGLFLLASVAGRRPGSLFRHPGDPALAAGALASLLLTVLLGPFGWKNMTDGFTVSRTSFLASVAEWTTAFEFARYPPVGRFWVFLAGGVVIAVVALVMERRQGRPPERAAGAGPSPFDVVILLLAVAMTLRARRFAPFVFITGPTVLSTLVVPRLRLLPAIWRNRLETAFPIVLLVAAAGIGAETWFDAHHKFVQRPGAAQNRNLLEAVTAADLIPADAIEYLRRNELRLNLMSEWTQAGPVLLHAPGVKIFLDGRAQQVFTEETYADYRAIFLTSQPDPRTVFEILDGHGSGAARHPSPPTDAVLLTKSPRTREVWKILDSNPAWVSVLLTDYSVLFVRRESRTFEQIRERIARGAEWRPDSPVAMASRGNVLLAGTPPDIEGAFRIFQEELERDARLGLNLYPMMVLILRGNGGPGAATRFLDFEKARIETTSGIDETNRKNLLSLLEKLSYR